MKKFLAFMFVVFSACVVGGIYGVLHDQFTYSISPEYYTTFKFNQFGLNDGSDGTVAARLKVAIVGFFATWWMGIPIGGILGLIGLIHNDWRSMLRSVSGGFLITLIIAFSAGLVGLTYGYLVLADQPRTAFDHWFIPSELVDFENFIAVGSMHNFSYAGGLIGMVAGGGYIAWKRMQIRKQRSYKFLWTNEKRE